MVHLAKNSNFIDNLINTLGVSKLGSPDSYASSIIKNALEDLTVASWAKGVVPGENVLFFFLINHHVLVGLDRIFINILIEPVVHEGDLKRYFKSKSDCLNIGKP